MRDLVIATLKKAMESTTIKHAKKSLKTEQDLLNLTDKSLMKIYDKVMKKDFIHYDSSHAQSIENDGCRDYMIDKLFERYADTDILYCPDIEDLISDIEYINDESDDYVIRLYKHNMFELNYDDEG